VRARAEWELGVTFHIHSDACYGGYAASLTRGPSGRRHTAEDVREACGSSDWPADEWLASVAALESADSVSIDPHKLGYAPYPAGAFLLKDKRGRELVATDPPYLAIASSAETSQPVIGRFIFEGSKPGASAAAVWLSHQTIPLNSDGHGRILASTMLAARKLYAFLGSSDFRPFRVLRLPEPDLNIVCFLLYHPSLPTLSALNDLNETIYRELSAHPGMRAPYMITRTTLRSPVYDGAIEPLLSPLGEAGDRYRKDISEGLTVLRATVMNPFSAECGPDHLLGLIDAVREVAVNFLRGSAEASESYSASSPILSAKST
jgi:glutamate/tyrosine decarboxylase-like PLP-dependent enzyme